jgi:hypothetical protein
MKNLASWVYVNLEKMRAIVSAIQYKMVATIKCSQEETKAAINSVPAELEQTAIHSIRSEIMETIKYRVEDVLSCAFQKTQGFLKQMTVKINETQVDL